MRNHLISGVSSGIGQAIARRLIAAGDNVTPIMRPGSVCRTKGLDEPIFLDFLKPNLDDSVLDRIQDSEFFSFINCAAVTLGKPVYDCTLSEIHDITYINLITPMMLAGLVAPRMSVGGAIILFSSQSAFKGWWDDCYNVSKGGINSFIKSFSIKVAPKIRVLGIAPGITINTGMTTNRKENDLDRKIKEIPLNRFCRPEELAELVFSLLGEAGACMTGNVIDVNGGSYLR